MKKLIKGLLGATAIAAVAYCGETQISPNEKYRINSGDIMFQYNYRTLKCERVPFDARSAFINILRNGASIIDEKYENMVGTTYLISFVDSRGTEKQAAVMDNYGECRLFQDVEIKKMKDVDFNKYINLREGL